MTFRVQPNYKIRLITVNRIKFLSDGYILFYKYHLIYQMVDSYINIYLIYIPVTDLYDLSLKLWDNLRIYNSFLINAQGNFTSKMYV